MSRMRRTTPKTVSNSSQLNTISLNCLNRTTSQTLHSTYRKGSSSLGMRPRPPPPRVNGEGRCERGKLPSKGPAPSSMFRATPFDTMCLKDARKFPDSDVPQQRFRQQSTTGNSLPSFLQAYKYIYFWKRFGNTSYPLIGKSQETTFHLGSHLD